ncbi:MAG: prolyl aminopeptidase [Propionicimonas sp.]
MHPPLEPFSHGLLDVGDGNDIYWEMCGNPDAKPALVVHGGPGSGATPWWRGFFDPTAYCVVLFDQRGCGRSTPHASDPGTDLGANTTAHLIADMEKLREHLAIDRWLVFGGSWGTTLGLAYAVEHPARVTEMVLFAITSTRRHEIEWLTRTLGRVFPEAWASFVAEVPVGERDGDLAAAYQRLLSSPDASSDASSDADVRVRASLAWCAWEDVIVSIHAGSTPSPRFEDERFRIAFTRLVTHYFSNAGFLEDDAIVGHLDRLAEIPAVLVHGRLDISTPLDTAWDIARGWPGAQLIVVDDAGHAGDESMNAVLLDALDRFANR